MDAMGKKHGDEHGYLCRSCQTTYKKRTGNYYEENRHWEERENKDVKCEIRVKLNKC